MVYFNLESDCKYTQNFSQMKIQRQKYYSDAVFLTLDSHLFFRTRILSLIIWEDGGDVFLHCLHPCFRYVISVFLNLTDLKYGFNEVYPICSINSGNGSYPPASMIKSYSRGALSLSSRAMSVSLNLTLGALLFC